MWRKQHVSQNLKEASEKKKCAIGKGADTELEGNVRASTRSREEGIHKDCKSEHSIELTKGNNAKDRCKVKWKRRQRK